MSRASTRQQRQVKLLSSDGWNFGELDMRQVGTHRQLQKQQHRELRPRPRKTPTVTKKKRGGATCKRGGNSRQQLKKGSAPNNLQTTAHARRATTVAPTTERMTRFSARRTEITGAPGRSADESRGNIDKSTVDTAPSVCRSQQPALRPSHNRVAAAGRRVPAAPRRRNPFAAAMKPPTANRTSSPRQPATALQRLRRVIPFARRTNPRVNSQACEPDAVNTTDGALFSPASLVTTPARFIRGVVGTSVQSLRTALFGEEKQEEVGGGGDMRGGTNSSDAGLGEGGGEGGGEGDGGSVAEGGARSGEAERRDNPEAAMVRRARRRPN